MIVKMFKPQFAPLVEQRKKLQTIRPTPKRRPKLGDEISLREWTGKPYRSKQRELRNSKITAIQEVWITSHIIILDGELVPEAKLDTFAQADGFKDWSEMRQWFQTEHDLPFGGLLYRWT